MKKKGVKRKTSIAAKTMGQSILADLTEFAEALESGVALDSKYTIRRVRVPDAPSEYTPRAIRATREKVGVSQAVFSHLLGVSTILVQAWEQGNRVRPRSERLSCPPSLGVNIHPHTHQPMRGITADGVEEWAGQRGGRADARAPSFARGCLIRRPIPRKRRGSIRRANFSDRVG
jgi:DNA-binding transcriptional regulator YiaG